MTVEERTELLEKFLPYYEKRHFKKCSRTTIVEMVKTFFPNGVLSFEDNKVKLFIDATSKLTEVSQIAFFKKLINYTIKIYDFNLKLVKHTKNCRKKTEVENIAECIPMDKTTEAIKEQIKESSYNHLIQKQKDLPIDYMFRIKWNQENNYDTIIGNSLEDAFSKAGYDSELLNEVQSYQIYPISNKVEGNKQYKLQISFQNGDNIFTSLEALEKTIQDFNIDLKSCKINLIKTLNEYDQVIDPDEAFCIKDFRKEVLNIEEEFEKKINLLKIKYSNLLNIEVPNIKINFTLI